MPTHTLQQRFAEQTQKKLLLHPDDKTLLAVSGGVDSVVMTHLFAQAGYNFGIAHCNFHLRGADADADESFVRSLAQQYNVPIHCTSFDTTNYAKKHKLSIEEAARELRYNFFAQTASQYNYRHIATAHHINDAIETFFINLIRGTGITGLHGIRPQNGNIIRPLLPFTRQEISNYATQHNLPFHEDRTNSETVFLRNKIRHNLLPLLKEISPQIEQTMAQNMANIADAEQIYKQAIEQKKQQIVRHHEGSIIISKNHIRQLQPSHTYMFETLRTFGFNSATVADILSAIDGTGKQFLTPTHTLLIDRDDIIIKPKSENTHTDQFEVVDGTTSTTLPIALTFKQAENKALATLQTSNDTIIVDSTKLKYPLTLRKWQSGDRFTPFGMTNSRKVSDFFKDNHLSMFEKKEKWLLCNADGQIIWIVGLRMDNHFRVTNNTTKTTIIQTSAKN